MDDRPWSLLLFKCQAKDTQGFVLFYSLFLFFVFKSRQYKEAIKINMIKIKFIIRTFLLFENNKIKKQCYVVSKQI